MKRLAMLTTAALAVFSVFAIALEPKFRFTALVNIAFITVFPFDVVFGLVVLCLLLFVAFGMPREEAAANKLIIWLVIGYVAYQLLIVSPIAVIAYGLRPIDVIRGMEARFSFAIIPFFYLLVLRLWQPKTIIAVFDAAALALVLWVLLRYAIAGGQGYVDGGVYRLRAVWGGASLLFGWLLLTSLFYWPLKAWRLGLGLLAAAGMVVANHRSGIVALIVALGTLFAAVRGVAKRGLALAGVLAVVAVGVYVSSPLVRESVAYSLRTLVNPTADVNATDRVTRSGLGLYYFAEHPLGDYIWSGRYYLADMGKRTFPPHNMVVQLLATQGVVGTALVLAIMGGSLTIAWRNRGSRLSAVMLSYLTYYAVFCLFNTNFDSPENFAFMYVSIALILSDNKRLEAERPAGLTDSSGLIFVGSVDDTVVRKNGDAPHRPLGTGR